MMQPSPQPAEATAQPCSTFEAFVPKGAKPGDTFSATTPAGQVVRVVVPEGAEPGDAVPVDLATATAVGAPAAGAHVSWGAAPPVQGQIVVGVPIGRADSFTLEEGRRPADRDENQANFGWTMYALGWCACCFLGPFGPICWFGAWLGHRLRPKEQRAQYPHERSVATLSCCTGISALVVHLVLVLGVFYYLRGANKACHAMYNQQKCISRRRPLLTFADVGAEWKAECPADCGPAHCYNKYVWGGWNGVYAEDSMLCGAALQSGVLEEGKGGWVLIRINRGHSFYPGIKQNGVESRDARNGLLSFSVAPLPVAGNATLGNDTLSTTTAAPAPTSTEEPSTTGSATSAETTTVPTSTTGAPTTTSATAPGSQ